MERNKIFIIAIIGAALVVALILINQSILSNALKEDPPQAKASSLPQTSSGSSVAQSASQDLPQEVTQVNVNVPQANNGMPKQLKPTKPSSDKDVILVQ